MADQIDARSKAATIGRPMKPEAPVTKMRCVVIPSCRRAASYN
jgi:hypothetical protein